MKTIQIPTDWTPEQAESIYRFLQNLQACIWLTYNNEIQNYYREVDNITVKDKQQMDEYDDFDDDIPF